MDRSWSRRNLLRTGFASAVMGAGGLVYATHPSSAAETTTVRGRLQAASREEVANDETNATTREGWFDTKTDKQGHFEIEVPTNNHYEIGYYKADERSDFEALLNGIPHIYEFGPIQVGSEEVDIGTKTLPEAHKVDVRVLKPNGEPLMGATPEFRYNGWGSNPSRTAVNTEGYAVIEGASFTGAEFVDHVTVEITPPPGDEYEDTTFQQYVSIDGPTLVTATIDSTGVSWEVNEHSKTDTSPTETSKRTTTSTKKTESAPQTLNRDNTTTPITTTKPSSTTSEHSSNQPPIPDHSTTTNSSNRGFFSNGNEGTPEIFKNAFNLTMIGFLLSVFGIVQQLVQGR